jgi:hypothetical protein
MYSGRGAHAFGRTTASTPVSASSRKKTGCCRRPGAQCGHWPFSGNTTFPAADDAPPPNAAAAGHGVWPSKRRRNASSPTVNSWKSAGAYACTTAISRAPADVEEGPALALLQACDGSDLEEVLAGEETDQGARGRTDHGQPALVGGHHDLCCPGGGVGGRHGGERDVRHAFAPAWPRPSQSPLGSSGARRRVTRGPPGDPARPPRGRCGGGPAPGRLRLRRAAGRRRPAAASGLRPRQTPRRKPRPSHQTHHGPKAPLGRGSCDSRARANPCCDRSAPIAAGSRLPETHPFAALGRLDPVLGSRQESCE